MNPPVDPDTSLPRRSSRRQRVGLAIVAVVLVVIVAVAVHKSRHRLEPRFNRTGMLESTARGIRSSLNTFFADAQKLSIATDKLVENPTPEALSSAQEAWVAFHLSEKRCQVLFPGPVKDRGFWAALFFNQVSHSAVENLIASDNPVNAELLEVAGARSKGNYVLEYLLFKPDIAAAQDSETNSAATPGGKLLAEGSLAERRRLYVRELVLALAQGVEDARNVANAPDFPSRFAAGKQDSATQVAANMVEVTERGLANPFDWYLRRSTNGTLFPSDVEGHASGTEISAMKALLEGARQFYRGDGPGVDQYLNEVNPELAGRFEKQFRATAEALDAVNVPFEQAVVTNRAAVESLRTQCKNLERLCKVDLPSALGVTVLFTSNDGD